MSYQIGVYRALMSVFQIWAGSTVNIKRILSIGYTAKYETAPNFIQFNLPVFTSSCDHKIVPQIKTKQFYDNTGKNR